VVLAGLIAVDAADADRAAYIEELGALRALAVQCLPHASTDSMFVYLQQAILGFDGDELWTKELDHVNDGEVDVRCPGCEEELVLDLTSEDSRIEPGLTSALAARLHAEAVQAGRGSVASALARLFDLAGHLAGVSYE
jgi:hypothetical protein